MRLLANDLNSAYEWLSDERFLDPGYSNLEWIDLDVKKRSIISETKREENSSNNNNNNNNNNKVKDDDIITMRNLPLYPLGAVYLPSRTTNHTLIIEPQNLQMAKDLLSSFTQNNHNGDDDEEAKNMLDGPLFCAVLRTMDTGRIASIGTVLRILEADPPPPYDLDDGKKGDRMERIRLTCQAQEIVMIEDILNPEAFGRERRIRKSTEYLRAWVRPLPTTEKTDQNAAFVAAVDDFQEEIATLINNFNMIKTIYQLQIGSQGFPPSMLFELGNAMTTWSIETFQSEMSFWEACQEWQSICYTLKHGKQALLSSNRNELMIRSIKGPLNLPIHMDNLDPSTRREVEQMEMEAQRDYLGLRMDPCLDFQALLSMLSYRERLRWLSQRVAYERRRLEMVASETSRARRM